MAHPILGFAPVRSPIASLGVMPSGKKNEFDEDTGLLVAVDSNHRLATVDVKALVTSIGASSVYAESSISEKVTLLEALRRRGISDIHFILEEDFQEVATLKAADNPWSHFLDVFPIDVKRALPQGSASSARALADDDADADDKLQGVVRYNPAVAEMRLLLNETRLLSTPSKDMQIAFAFYDKLAAIFSYTSAGASPVLDKRHSYFQMIPNGIPLPIDIYRAKPPITPLTPQGDLTTTEEFSSIASMAFDTNGRLDPSKNVEDAFGVVINGANSSAPPDDKAIDVLNKVRAYLKVIKKDEFTGEEYETDTLQYASYKKAVIAHRIALATYYATRDQYDLTKPDDQRKWQIDALVLQAKIDEAKNELDTHTTVKKALQYLQTYGNNAVVNVITEGKNSYDQGSVTSQILPGQNFHVSYGFPADWYREDTSYSAVSVSTHDFSSSYSHEATSYSGGGSYGAGWFSVGGSFSSSREETREHIETSDFQFDFEVATIAIERPWMDATLFGLDAWNIGGQPAGKVSSGNFPAHDRDVSRRILPYYSTALVIARNVKISGSWSESDLRILKKSVSGSASVSCGPFRCGGASYSKSSVKRDFNSTYSDGTFTIPGAQVIGVINTVVPHAAPDNG